ncbi:MAG: hypothetical protein Q9163_005950 [Psora crenata]
MFASQQADFASMVTTTILFIVVLSSPRTLATASPAYPDPTRESYSNEKTARAEQAWINIVLLFVFSILAAVAENRATWIGQKIGLRLSSNRKLFRKSSQAEEAEETSPPVEKRLPQANVRTIMNLLATDAFKIADAGANMHQVWASVPVQIIVAITLLYLTLGFSAFAGVALMAVMVPLNSRIARKFGDLQMDVIAASDVRIQKTTEMVRNVRIIKFLAWETLFERSIEGKRAEELRALRARYIMSSIAATIWYGMPVLITFTSFLVYAGIVQKSLTPSLAFTSLSLFNLLKKPLDDFVGAFARVEDSLVSVKRVEKFLAEEETDKYEQLSRREPKDSCKIGFEHASLVWRDCTEDHTAGDSPDDEASNIDYSFARKGLNLKFAIGKLNVITGVTGSGKSSMLLALLGEMTLVKGTVHMPAAMNLESLSDKSDNRLIDSVAYCAQEAWLTNDTVRNNILFGSPYSAERYKAVLSACALVLDLQTLAHGDLTWELIKQETTNESQDDSPANEEAQSDGKIPWRNVLNNLDPLPQSGGLELSNAYERTGEQATKDYLGRVPSNGTRSNHPSSTHSIELGYYFGTYALIIGAFLVVGLLRLLLVSCGSLEASAKLHRRLMESIMNAKFRFFDDTSFGHIINNFSRDLQLIDQDLAVMAVATLHFLVALAGIIILIAVITPAFLGPGIFISIGYYLIGVTYMTAARDLKQIESTQRSPLLQHLSETLSGITTIRAYGKSGHYSAENLNQIDRANRPSFFLAAAERWLAIGLGLILQRIHEYVDLPQEGSGNINDASVTDQWPNSGVVEYDDVSASYAPSLDLVLRKVTFSINHLERVGIVGRTGAGKTSLALTLLRALEIQSGTIRIDGVIRSGTCHSNEQCGKARHGLLRILA